MRIVRKSFVFGLCMCAVGIAYADPTSTDLKTVSSKAYVDTSVETRQAKIPAADTNSGTPGVSVVTYTTTGNGTIGERGIYSGNSTYNSTNDENKLATAGSVKEFVNKVSGLTVKVEHLECANDDCTLYEVVTNDVYFSQMTQDGGAPYFAPWQGCSAQGVTCVNDSECCSHRCAMIISIGGSGGKVCS